MRLLVNLGETVVAEAKGYLLLYKYEKYGSKFQLLSCKNSGEKAFNMRKSMRNFVSTVTHRGKA